MKRSVLWWVPAASMAALAVASGAAAQTAKPQLDVKIERDTRPRTAVSELGVYHTVALTDRTTGHAPSRPYVVYGQGTNKAGEETAFTDCDRASDTDSRATPGVYNCTLYVDHGGTWDFTAIVKERPEKPGEVTTEVARASVPFELASNLLYAAKQNQITTRPTAVMLLWIHVLATTLWFVCVALLAALALPEARRRISNFGLHRLERRLADLLRLTWVTTATVVGTGIYLLLNETAYKTPFSTTKMHAVFKLPYAKPYFVALGAKLSLYAVMMLAVVPLVAGARRHLHLAVRSAKPEPAPIARGDDGGAVATLTRTTVAPSASQQLQPSRTRLSRIALAVLAGGALGISLSVTLLKYFHQIIEAVPR